MSFDQTYILPEGVQEEDTEDEEADSGSDSDRTPMVLGHLPANVEDVRRASIRSQMARVMSPSVLIETETASSSDADSLADDYPEESDLFVNPVRPSSTFSDSTTSSSQVK